MTDTTILDVVVEIAIPIVTACTPILTYKLWQLVGVKVTDQNKAIVDTAIERGVGTALAHGQSVGDALLADPSNKNTALVKANQYVMTHAGDEVAALGSNGAAIAEKVSAALAVELNKAPGTTAPIVPVDTKGVLVS